MPHPPPLSLILDSAWSWGGIEAAGAIGMSAVDKKKIKGRKPDTDDYSAIGFDPGGNLWVCWESKNAWNSAKTLLLLVKEASVK